MCNPTNTRLKQCSDTLLVSDVGPTIQEAEASFPPQKLVPCTPSSSSSAELDAPAPLVLDTLSLQTLYEAKTMFTHDNHQKGAGTHLWVMEQAAFKKLKEPQYLTADHQRPTYEQMDRIEYHVSNTQQFNKKASLNEDERSKVALWLFPLPCDRITIAKKPMLDFTTPAPEESAKPHPELSGIDENKESERLVHSMKLAAEKDFSVSPKPQNAPDECPGRLFGAYNHLGVTEKDQESLPELVSSRMLFQHPSQDMLHLLFPMRRSQSRPPEACLAARLTLPRGRGRRPRCSQSRPLKRLTTRSHFMVPLQRAKSLRSRDWPPRATKCHPPEALLLPVLGESSEPLNDATFKTTASASEEPISAGLHARSVAK
ncbi:hypothetical protein HPB51_014230 [Rhipicephalus microplus]|uniref:Uncharacterized protein n=1 Tax=Rhipicephalus microplus TaxID=6941 RepID=A0A9J6D5A7_RHIMP|nr:hypothetical protein HPB51_014230 [Rhipicephalus microplus]